MRHTLSVLVENKFGVLTRISGLFSGRGFNIDTLNVAPTQDPTQSRMTIVVDASKTNATMVANNLFKLVNVIDVQDVSHEPAVTRDLALIKAERGDRWGNLTYRMAARNFGPVMAMACKKTVASVHEIDELGELNPEHIVTPGIFVHQIVKIERQATQAGGFKKVA